MCKWLVIPASVLEVLLITSPAYKVHREGEGANEDKSLHCRLQNLLD